MLPFHQLPQHLSLVDKAINTSSSSSTLLVAGSVINNLSFPFFTSRTWTRTSNMIPYLGNKRSGTAHTMTGWRLMASPIKSSSYGNMGWALQRGPPTWCKASTHCNARGGVRDASAKRRQKLVGIARSPPRLGAAGTRAADAPTGLACLPLAPDRSVFDELLSCTICVYPPGPAGC